MSPTTTDDHTATRCDDCFRAGGKSSGRSQASQSSLLSARVSKNIGDTAIMQRFALILANQYDAEHNPQGIINLGVAENVRCPLPVRCTQSTDVWSPIRH